MTDKELEEFIHRGETGFVAVAMMFGEGWAQHAIDIAKELRARLAQGEQKSQAWMLITESGVCGGIFRFRYDAEVQARELGSRFSIVPLYAAPTQRAWQDISEEELCDVCEALGVNAAGPASDAIDALKQAISAKLNEKNT